MVNFISRMKSKSTITSNKIDDLTLGVDGQLSIYNTKYIRLGKNRA